MFHFGFLILLHQTAFQHVITTQKFFSLLVRNFINNISTKIKYIPNDATEEKKEAFKTKTKYDEGKNQNEQKCEFFLDSNISNDFHENKKFNPHRQKNMII